MSKYNGSNELSKVFISKEVQKVFTDLVDLFYEVNENPRLKTIFTDHQGQERLNSIDKRDLKNRIVGQVWKLKPLYRKKIFRFAGVAKVNVKENTYSVDAKCPCCVEKIIHMIYNVMLVLIGDMIDYDGNILFFDAGIDDDWRADNFPLGDHFIA